MKYKKGQVSTPTNVMDAENLMQGEKLKNDNWDMENGQFVGEDGKWIIIT